MLGLLHFVHHNGHLVQRGLLLQHFFLGLSLATLLAFTGVLLLGLTMVLLCPASHQLFAGFVNCGLYCQNWQT